MTVTTKFNVGDEIYVPYKGETKQGVVTEIDVAAVKNEVEICYVVSLTEVGEKIVSEKVLRSYGLI